MRPFRHCVWGNGQHNIITPLPLAHLAAVVDLMPQTHLIRNGESTASGLLEACAATWIFSLSSPLIITLEAVKTPIAFLLAFRLEIATKSDTMWHCWYYDTTVWECKHLPTPTAVLTSSTFLRHCTQGCIAGRIMCGFMWMEIQLECNLQQSRNYIQSKDLTFVRPWIERGIQFASGPLVPACC